MESATWGPCVMKEVRFGSDPAWGVDAGDAGVLMPPK